MAYELIHGDCVEAMRCLETASVDAVVTDPPYGWRFMGKAWDAPDIRAMYHRDCRADVIDKIRTRESMAAGKYDRSTNANRQFQTWTEAWAIEALRVLKPGGHLLSFCGPRTYHRMAAGVEDAGFEIRDVMAWLFGSGFPKSHNLKGEHEGWGTALKPAFEPIVVARKPLIGTVATNVEAHGTGALNVDGCRVETNGEANPTIARRQGSTNHLSDAPAAASEAAGSMKDRRSPEQYRRPRPGDDLGRWPANVVLDQDAAAQLDGLSGDLTSGACPTRRNADKFRSAYGKFEGQREFASARRENSGGASRFYYCAKASKADRGADNTHPTVKPVSLMRWLVRLVTPLGGLVLDPFGGSGSTGVACAEEGVRCILIEREPAYMQIIQRRMAAANEQQRLDFGEAS